MIKSESRPKFSIPIELPNVLRTLSEDCVSMPMFMRKPCWEDSAKKPAAATIDGVMNGKEKSVSRILLKRQVYLPRNQAIGVPIINARDAEKNAWTKEKVIVEWSKVLSWTKSIIDEIDQFDTNINRSKARNTGA